MKHIFNACLLLLWMGLIYYFSSQTGLESSNSSQFFLTLIDFLGINFNSSLGVLTHSLFRKAAHMFEYYILCLLIYNFIKDFIKHHMFYSIIFSLIYACTDEVHQLFVMDRGPSVIDVIIDTFGAILAMITVKLYMKIKKL